MRPQRFTTAPTPAMNGLDRGEIQLDGAGVGAASTDPLDDRFGLLPLPEEGDRHAGSLASKKERRGPPDAARAGRDDRHPIRESEIHGASAAQHIRSPRRAIGRIGHSRAATERLENRCATRESDRVLPAIQSVRPSPLLAPVIEDAGVYVPVAGGAHRVELLPDGTTSLMFRVVEDGRRGDVSVLGPRARSLFKTAPAVPLCIVVRFRPGAGGPLLGVRASELTNRFVLLEDIWGTEGVSVRRRLLAARGMANVIAELHRILLRVRTYGSPAERPSPSAGVHRVGSRR